MIRNPLLQQQYAYSNDLTAGQVRGELFSNFYYGSRQIGDLRERWRAWDQAERGELEMVAPETLSEENADIGITFDEPMTREEAGILRERHIQMQIHNRLVGMGPQTWAAMGGNFLAMLAGSITDPVELPMMFVPIVGPTHRAALAARYGTRGGRIAQGAIEGAVGTAMFEPMYHYSFNQAQLDYTLYDSALAVSMGGLFGGSVGALRGWNAVRAERRLERAQAAVEATERAAAEGRFNDVDLTNLRPHDLDLPTRQRLAGAIALAQASNGVEINVHGLVDEVDIAKHIPEVRAERERMVRDAVDAGVDPKIAANHADLVTSMHYAMMQRHGWTLADTRALMEDFQGVRSISDAQMIAEAASSGARIEIEIDGTPHDLNRVHAEHGPQAVRDLLAQADEAAVRRGVAQAVAGVRPAGRPVDTNTLRGLLAQIDEAPDSVSAHQMRSRLGKGDDVDGVRVVKEGPRKWRVDSEGEPRTYRTKKAAIEAAYASVRGVDPDTATPRTAKAPSETLIDALRARNLSSEQHQLVRQILAKLPENELRQIVEAALGGKVKSAKGAMAKARQPRPIPEHLRPAIDELESALNSSQRETLFPAAFETVKAMKAADVRRISEAFTGRPGKTKREALERIRRRYEAIVDEKKRQSHVDGRTAGQVTWLYQTGGANARAMAEALASGQAVVRGLFDTETGGTTLLRHANATTLFHESGHAFLHLLLRAAETERASDSLVRDAATVRDWLGVRDYNGLTREADERFAEAFEVYLSRGEAPSSTLRQVFEDFRKWLLKIFQTESERARRFGEREPFSPEVRAVVDRLVAPDEMFDARRALGEALDPSLASRPGAAFTDRISDAYARFRKAMPGGEARASEERIEIEALAADAEARLRAELDPPGERMATQLAEGQATKAGASQAAEAPLSELMRRSGRYDEIEVQTMEHAEARGAAMDSLEAAAREIEASIAAGRVADDQLEAAARRVEGVDEEDLAELLSIARANAMEPRYQISDVIESFVEMRRTAVQHQRYWAAQNSAIAQQILAEIDTAYRERENASLAIQARESGINTPLSGGRMSADARGNAGAQMMNGSLFSELKQAGVDAPLRKGQLDEDFVRELHAIQTGASGPATANKKARIAAEIAERYLETARKRANMSGAGVGRLEGRILKNSHSYRRIVGAGLDKWARFVEPLLDWKRIGIDANDAARVRQFLEESYTTLTTGVAKNSDVPSDVAAAFKGPRNVARAMSQHRALHWADGDAWLKYNRKFGEATILESLFADIERTMRGAGLLDTWGSNPAAMLDLVRRKAEQLYRRTQPEILDQINSRHLDHVMMEIDGRSMSVPNTRRAHIIADASSATRGFTSTTTLGMATLSALGDIGANFSEMRNWGVPALRAIVDSFRAAFEGVRNARGWGDTQFREYLDMIGVGIDGSLGVMTSRLEIGDWYSKTMRRGLTKFFKLSLLTQFTDAIKRGSAIMLSSWLSKSGPDGFRQNEQLGRLLTLYGFDEASWREAHKLGRAKISGYDVVDPRLIFKAAERASGDQRAHLISLGERLQTMLVDRTEFASPAPGANERALLRQGLSRGTVAAEALSMFAQFKAFPVTILSKTWGAALHTRGAHTRGRGIRAHARGLLNWGNAADAGAFIAVAWAMGTVAMMAKDIAKGREPREMSWNAALAALLQSGGLGIYGDFLLGHTSRFGGSLVETLAGPVPSKIGDIQKLASGLAYGELGDDQGAGEVLNLIKNNIPGANIFYVKAAIDHGIFFPLAEMANPGYLRRMERRMKRDHNAEFLLPPSQMFGAASTRNRADR